MAWYLVCLLGGMVVGIIVGVLIDRDTVNKYFQKIRKVKVKGEGNVVSDLISMEDLRKKQKEERRALRKAK